MVIKKRTILLLSIGLLTLGVASIIVYLKYDDSRQITFEQCQSAGGVAWLVDIYHPDICPSCAEYQACKAESDDCPQVKSCTECMDSNFPYPDKCPDGKEKIGEISDAAIWFQCCK